MEVSIKGHQIEVTEPLSSFIRERLNRLKARLEDVTHVVVAISGIHKNGKVPSIQVVVHFVRGQKIVITQFLKRTATDFYGTVNNVFDKLGVSLERHAGASDKKHHNHERGIVRRNKAFAAA